MSGRPVIVVGAGGHGQVVADALQASGRVVLGFVEPAAAPGAAIAGLPVLGDDGWLKTDGGYDLANGLGGTGEASGRGRRRVVQARLEAAGFSFVDVRHPTAVASPAAGIGPGVQLLARAVVQAGARVGAGAIINTGAIVEHGCRVGAFSHCATGAILCGDVTIGEDAHVGAGAVIRQGVTLEDGVVVGAGAVVLEPGTGRGPLIGVPARRRERT
ncbi:NeuD/PglB/VioB family sugar acetyltransferase [Brevundimonas sp.]|uniref:NeuD/PglB/VioB family sugar acetyltransferase n=1 Tax=Brevundimonas sp. TaxID=1871086 RepID=UPI002D33B1BA|nr:NeuD/PglB/VioB family sugar acetyltransferase [Brevundimonas sp.]HYC67381.1 NeuD/PglB/VioB family sugar acetyltransferase [Brevundimonas sp.]